MYTMYLQYLDNISRVCVLYTCYLNQSRKYVYTVEWIILTLYTYTIYLH